MIVCDIQINFPEIFLSAILKAMKENRVHWRGFAQWAEYSQGVFEWLGARYKVEEYCERVIQIEHIDGVLDDSIIFEILK